MEVPSLTGKGLDIVKMINKLPFQLHLPGHNYTGPGTHLYRNLALNIKPINKVDEASFYHDLDYSQGIDKRIADDKLIDKTQEIYKDSNNSIRERGEAFLVNNIMKFKTLLGAGIEPNDLLSMKLKFIKFLEENVSSKKEIDNLAINEENLNFLKDIANTYNFSVIK